MLVDSEFHVPSAMASHWKIKYICLLKWQKEKKKTTYINDRKFHHDIKVNSLKIIQITDRSLKKQQFDQTWSDFSLNVWLWHPSGQKTVSECLPRGTANGFTVLPDRVYRPNIMFFFSFFKYAFLSFVWRAEDGAWQQSMKRVKLFCLLAPLPWL